MDTTHSTPCSGLIKHILICSSLLQIYKQKPKIELKPDHIKPADLMVCSNWFHGRFAGTSVMVCLAKFYRCIG